MSKPLKHAEITGEIIKSFYKVYNTLGYGFKEKVYENSLALELIGSGLAISQQRPIEVFYAGVLVGEYFADLVVNDLVIIELKASVSLSEAYDSQLLNYLKATKIEVGLLLNFGQKPEYRRKFFTNDKKDLRTILLDP
jgi:GxxExxY protein